MLSNEVSNTGKFSVVERHKLEPVLTEPDLAVSSRIAKGSGAKVGGMTGAQHPAFETVVAFERKVRDARGRISFTGIYVGGNKDSVSITVDLRVVNTSTGAVDYSRTVEARSDGAGPSLGLFQGGFGGSLKNGDRAPAGNAIHVVIVEISDYLVCAMVRQDGCMADFDARENRRRVSLNDQIELDGL